MKREDQDPSAPADKIGKKKPYEKPAWEIEKAFAEGGPDTTCAKADSGLCGPGPVQS